MEAGRLVAVGRRTAPGRRSTASSTRRPTPGGRARRRRPGRPRRPGDRVPGAPRRPGRPLAGRAAGRRGHHRRRQHQGRARRARRRRGPALRRRPPDGRARDGRLRGVGGRTCSSTGPGSSSPAPRPTPADVERVARSGARLRRAGRADGRRGARRARSPAISHLPLIIAAALVEAVAGRRRAPRPDWPAARDLAASGWRDMTRLARGDPAMGAADRGHQRAGAWPARLRDVRAVLDGWLAELERPGGPDEAGARGTGCAPRASRLEGGSS